MLSGYKTYIVAGLIAVATFFKSAGFIDEATFQAFLGLLSAAGLATLRQGVSKGPNA